MKKFLLLILVLGVLCATFCACGTSNDYINRNEVPEGVVTRSEFYATHNEPTGPSCSVCETPFSETLEYKDTGVCEGCAEIVYR